LVFRRCPKLARILIKSVSKTFFNEKTGEHVHALENVSLTVEDGEFVCIVGPSGCGKTTLLNIVAGLEKPTKGEVLVDGKPVVSPGPDRVMVFQEYALFPWRTVLGNVEFGLEIAGVPREERRKIALRYIRLVGLSGFENKYPHELSGGMKQRVALARALVMNPKVLLMDEPFGALDAQTRNIMQAELLRIWQATRKTILFVTHSILEAVYFADRVVVLTARPGRVKRIFKVNLERPRKKGSPEFMEVRNAILEELKEEVLASLKAELGREVYETKKLIG